MADAMIEAENKKPEAAGEGIPQIAGWPICHWRCFSTTCVGAAQTIPRETLFCMIKKRLARHTAVIDGAYNRQGGLNI